MSTPNKVLTSKGYSILKESLTKDEVKQIEEELTVKPRTLQKFATAVPEFKIYAESTARYYLPRAWAADIFGPPEAVTVKPGIPLPPTVTFKGTPYPYQQEIIDKFVGQGANGLICVPCGRGKTFMALAIAIKLGKRFLIVVDKEFLMNQWKGEIERYIDGARIGIIQGDSHQCGTEVVVSKGLGLSEMKKLAKEAGLKVSGTKEELTNRLIEAKIDVGPKTETVEYDITICMIQTICLRDYPVDTFSGYGFTIFDECHHLGAQYFSGVLRKIQTPHMLGLSATPDRDDGLTKVFEYYLGKPVYQEKTREPDPTVQVKALWYHNDDPAYADLPLDWRGELVTARLMTQVVTCKARTEFVLEHLKDLVTDPRRKVLVLSERRDHLAQIDAGLPEATSRGYYVGGMKQADLDTNAETCQVLLATYAMASEAMNIKALNAMIMASPRKKVEQSTGRILRTTVDKRVIEPLIIDVIDQHETYVRQWQLRQRYYKKCAYSIEHVGKQIKDDRGKPAVVPENCLIVL
uniref:Helicase ATP-binding domain-containing protein n=1 Tax=viral metagenome TaxID=1070528 RepID=A0A6C0ANQ2_9ZZZZ